MAYQSNSPMFRSLDDAEEAGFRQWAHEFDPTPYAERGTLDILHPVVRDEWVRMGLLNPEAANG